LISEKKTGICSVRAWPLTMSMWLKENDTKLEKCFKPFPCHHFQTRATRKINFRIITNMECIFTSLHRTTWLDRKVLTASVDWPSVMSVLDIGA
jgi:hypothetical protein